MSDSEIKRLRDCMQDNRLCGINRDMIDDLTTFGFPVALSENLVLVANVYNFDIDGYKVLRTQDITEVFSGEEEEFTEMILRREKILDGFNPENIDISGLKAVFKALEDRNIIVQCESTEEIYFYEGRVTAVNKGEIVMKIFDSLGVWDDEEQHIPLNKITSVSFGGRYISLMSKYIEKIWDKKIGH